MATHPGECGHGYSTPDDLHDVECCVCSYNPCVAVTVEQMNEHRAYDVTRMGALWNREVEYVLAHGKRQEVPF